MGYSARRLWFQNEMNILTHSVSAVRPNESFDSSHPIRRLISTQPRLGTSNKGEALERSIARDAQISSLKILALSLLKQIEALEREDSNRQVASLPTGSIGLDLQNEVRHFEAELIRAALVKTGGRQRRAAKLLGMKVTTLNAKIRRYHLTANGSSVVCNDMAADPENPDLQVVLPT